MSKQVWRFDPEYGLEEEDCVQQAIVEDDAPIGVWIQMFGSGYAYLETEKEALELHKKCIEEYIALYQNMLKTIEFKLKEKQNETK